MKNTKFLLAAVASLGACTLPPTQAELDANPSAGWEAGIAGPGGDLYGRDGVPVGSNLSGPVTVSNETLNHTPDSAGGTRPSILELYQAAVDENEYLGLELASFEEERRNFLELQKGNVDMIKDLKAEVAGLEAENNELKAQSFDLGDRLAMAQLRRLEAEKALLEHTLATRQAAAAAEALAEAAE